MGSQTVLLALVAIAILAVAFVASRLVSTLANWAPAGPIALIAGAPLIPHVSVIASLSLDDLLPVLGAGLLVIQLPRPQLTQSRLLQFVLASVVAATIARVLSSFANGGSPEGTILMLAQAVGRPAILVALAAYVAIAAPADRRYRFVAITIALVGTFEAIFGLIAFAVPLPGGIGMQAAMSFESLYGVCPGRIVGTLGLSPNHSGAVFVLATPMTLGLAVRAPDWKRWLWAGAGAAQGAAVFLTFTRASILIAAVGGLLFLLLERRFRLAAGVALATIALAALISTLGCGGVGQKPVSGVALLESRFQDSNDRLALWYAAARIMVDYPLAGIGLGRLQEFVLAHPTTYGETPFGEAMNSAHNTILLAGAETGVLGAVGTLGVNLGLGVGALGLIWLRWRRREVLLGAAGFALGCYLLQGMVNNLFTVPATSVLLALVAGAFLGGGSNVGRDGSEGVAQSW